MTKFWAIFFSSILFCSASCALDLNLEAESALVINVDTQAILYEKNANQKLPPASITKIATALFALKEVGDDLDVVLSADQDCVGSITEQMQKTMNFNYPPHWQVIGGTHMGIARGDKLSLEELFYGMMLVSANDASNMIAKYVSGTIRQFMFDLNDYLEELGCENTLFLNPHGLHFPKQVTTAKDMALITSEALKHPFFRTIIQTQKRGKLKNSNYLVREDSSYYYPYAIGVKTGFHSDAKHNLVTAAERDGRTLLAILMRCPAGSKFEDARKVFQAAFAEKLHKEVYLEKGQQQFKYKIEGVRKPLKTYLEEPVTLQYYPSEKPQVKGTVYWHSPALPILKGDVVADLILKDERDVVLMEVPLRAYQKIAPLSFKKIRTFFVWMFAILILGFLGIQGLKRFKKSRPGRDI